MLTSFLNTQSEIQSKLVNGIAKSHTITIGVTPIVIPVIYARESAKTNTQKTRQSYPLISLYDYFPEYDIEWNPNFQSIIDGYHTIVSGSPTQAYLYKEPLRYLLRYDLTFYVQNPMHRYAVMDYMAKTFSKSGRFVLNETVLPEGSVGDFVTYNVSPTENERQDGIMEMNYEFNIKAMINLIDPIEVNLITNFTLNLNNVQP